MFKSGVHGFLVSIPVVLICGCDDNDPNYVQEKDQKSACEKYIDAVEECADNAGANANDDEYGFIDGPGASTDDFCEHDEGTTNYEYLCMALAYRDSDCSNTNDLVDASADAAACYEDDDTGENE